MAKATLADLIRKHSAKKPDDLLAIVMKSGYPKQQVFKTASRLRKMGEKIPYFTQTPPDRQPNPDKQPKVGPSSRTATISVSDFIRKNDIGIIVMEAVKQIKEGDMYDKASFIRTFLPGKSNYSAVLESEEISKYCGRSGGKVYFGHPKDIKDLKQRGLLT